MIGETIRPPLRRAVSSRAECSPPEAIPRPKNERVRELPSRAENGYLAMGVNVEGWFCGTLGGNSRDIDNRIKVLFDALRLPTIDEIRDFRREQHEVPFLCLLEDDSLITELKVTTDRLLIPPMGSGNHISSDVHLVIHVKTDVVDRGREWQLY